MLVRTKRLCYTQGMTPEELFYKDAQDAIKKGDLEQARELFKRLLKLNSTKPEYWVWLSAVVETKKERGYCLKEALKLDPQNRDAIRGLRLMGEDLLDSGPVVTIDQLRNHWKTSLEIEPIKPVSTRSIRGKILGFVLLGMIVVGAAVAGILLTSKEKPQVDTSTILRWSITPSGTPTETATVTPTFAGTQPLWTLLGSTFTPTPVFVSTPHNRTEAFTAALRAYDHQDWSNAAEYFKQVLQGEPNSPDILFLLGEVYRFQKSYKEAIASYDAAIKLDPSFGPAYLGKGRALLLSDPKKTAEAGANFQKAVENDPNLSEAFLELANISLINEDASAALGLLDKTKALSGDSALIEYFRARVFLMQNENKMALTSIEKARDMDRTYLPVYRLWGQILQQNDKYRESIPPLLTYLKYDPLDLVSEVYLARAYADSGDLKNALNTVNIAVSSDNKYVDALVTRGDIYMLQGEIPLAEKDYDTALGLNYKSFEARIGKGRAQMAVTFFGAAYATFEKAEVYSKTDTQKAIFLYWRATALVGLKEINAAIRDFEAFLAYPTEKVPASFRIKALAEYLKIVTPTPSRTPTITNTPKPSITLTP
jgi:tetratricopeptide (TPR) repeat protein